MLKSCSQREAHKSRKHFQTHSRENFYEGFVRNLVDVHSCRGRLQRRQSKSFLSETSSDPDGRKAHHRAAEQERRPTQGQNEFALQFKDDQGQPADVGDVQIGSSMSMPSMAPMSGDSELTPTGQTGIYKVTSNFAMSGAWHFTLSWNGPYGQGHTTFN